MGNRNDSTLDRDEYLRRAREFALRGNRLPHAKLNPETVRAIRVNRHGWTAKKWAQHLGLHIRTVEGVRSFRTWKHV